MPNGNIDFVTHTILNSENPFVLGCKKICRNKALSSCFKTKDWNIEPLEKIVGYDYKTGKPECLKIYIPILSTIKVLLQRGCTRNCVYAAAVKWSQCL